MNCNGKEFREAYVKLRGNRNTVSGAFCTVTGDHNRVSGAYARVYGDDNVVSGAFATVVGKRNIVSGSYAKARGRDNKVTGVFSENVEEDVSTSPAKKTCKRSANVVVKPIQAVSRGGMIGFYQPNATFVNTTPSDQTVRVPGKDFLPGFYQPNATFVNTTPSDQTVQVLGKDSLLAFNQSNATFVNTIPSGQIVQDLPGMHFGSGWTFVNCVGPDGKPLCTTRSLGGDAGVEQIIDGNVSFTQTFDADGTMVQTVSSSGSTSANQTSSVATTSTNNTVIDAKVLPSVDVESTDKSDPVTVCVICMERLRKTIFSCGHMSTCCTCALKLSSTNPHIGKKLECPVCRQPTTTITLALL